MKKYFAIALMVLAITSLSAKETYVYFSVNGQKKIKIYKLDTENKELVFFKSKTTVGEPFALNTSSDNKYLFASILSTQQASSFTINQEDGSLTDLNTVKIADGACHLGVSKNDKYLLAAYWGGDMADVYPIDSDGKLNGTSSDEAKYVKNDHPHMIMPNPDGDVVYVTHMGGHRVMQYSFNQETGKLTALDPAMLDAADGSGPRHLIFHPTLDVVYFSLETSSQTMVCNHSSAGLSDPVQTIENLPAGYTGRKWSSDIHITPNGKFLYTANRDHGTIAGFFVDATTGKLSLIDRFDTEEVVREFDIDPSGKFLIAAGERSGKAILYEIEADGKLKNLASYTVGAQLWWVTMVEVEGKEEPPVTKIHATNSEELKIFPNPCKDRFTLKLAEPLAVNAQVQLINASGKTVLEKFAKENTDKLSFDISEQPKGVYYVLLRNNGKTYTSKVLSL